MDARAELAELEVKHLHCIERADFRLRHIRTELKAAAAKKAADATKPKTKEHTLVSSGEKSVS
jgi:hypothetical protein